MLVGLGIGAIVTPPLIAQDNGVFDEIICNRLIVLNQQGKPAILLTSTDKGNIFGMMNPQGNKAISLTSTDDENTLMIITPAGKGGCLIDSSNHSNSLTLLQEDNIGIALESGPGMRYITLLNAEQQPLINLIGHDSGTSLIELTTSTDKKAVLLESRFDGSSNDMVLYDKLGNAIWQASRIRK